MLFYGLVFETPAIAQHLLEEIYL